MGLLCSRSTEMLSVLLLLVLLILGGGYDVNDDHGNIDGRRYCWTAFIRGAYSAASPLSGTKTTMPWSFFNQQGFNYIPTSYDLRQEKTLTKLLDVGACRYLFDQEMSYVPPLDGTIPSETVCQDVYAMRFVLFDLQLVNVDEVDALSGSFTAQVQLVFHWREGWEQVQGTDISVETGHVMETADEASTCAFVCDTTSAVKKCCDGMWVPQFQLPSCKVNDVQSVLAPPYLYTIEGEHVTSFWNVSSTLAYSQYSLRRTWYVGLDVTCPFTPQFENFPFDYQFLTIDIINPYTSRTWLQLNKGFLQANIMDSIAGINLSPDDKIGGWRIKDLIVSSACGTQQTWTPTFLSQDYLLHLLGVNYTSQKASIQDALSSLACAQIKDLNLEQATETSFTNPANVQPYNQARSDYIQRLNDTIARYQECSDESNVADFTWNTSIVLGTKMPQDIGQLNVSDPFNLDRSFNFLDFQLQQDPIPGIDFRCAIKAVANLTTPGIRINIITQRFKMYYWVKLILPTCACVGFSFLAFGLKMDDILGRLTIIVPSAIALSTLQGFVVATDIPAIAYMAPTTWIVLSSYLTQLLIAGESILIKILHSRFVVKEERSHTSDESAKSGPKTGPGFPILEGTPADTQQIEGSPGDAQQIAANGSDQLSADNGDDQGNKGQCSTNENKRGGIIYRAKDGKSSLIKSGDRPTSGTSTTYSQVVPGGGTPVHPQQNKSDSQQAKNTAKPNYARERLRNLDWFLAGALFSCYSLVIVVFIFAPLFKSVSSLKSRKPLGYESLWVRKH